VTNMWDRTRPSTSITHLESTAGTRPSTRSLSCKLTGLLGPNTFNKPQPYCARPNTNKGPGGSTRCNSPWALAASQCNYNTSVPTSQETHTIDPSQIVPWTLALKGDMGMNEKGHRSFWTEACYRALNLHSVNPSIRTSLQDPSEVPPNHTHCNCPK
jgi:hypothetical protein